MSSKQSQKGDRKQQNTAQRTNHNIINKSCRNSSDIDSQTLTIRIRMEVVSPITFAHSNGGSKRRFGCADPTTSPATFAPSSPHHHSADENMDDGSGGYGFHATKRRRKNSQDCAGSSALLQKENNWSISPFLSGTAAMSQPGGQSPITGGEFIVFILIGPCYFIALSHCPFLFPSSFIRKQQAISYHLPSTQFWVIGITASPFQSCPSKDPGVTTSSAATSCSNRPPQN